MKNFNLGTSMNQLTRTLCTALLLAAALPLQAQTAPASLGAAPAVTLGTAVVGAGMAGPTSSVPSSGLSNASLPSLNPTEAAQVATALQSASEANKNGESPAEKASDSTAASVKDNNNAPGDEFQRYVARVVGSPLPLFGSQLFSGGPSTYAPIDNVPVTSDYVLGPGDELVIRAWGAIDVEARTVIDRNGQISIPKVGTIGLTGIRASDVEGYLRSKIARVFKNFELNVTLGQLRSIRVYVVGHAKRPGAYTLSSLSTLINALFASGGPAPTGSMRKIQLKRSGQVITEVDLYDFIIKGDSRRDERLLPGDVIVIPPAGPRVAVAGTFNAPAIFELKNSGASIHDVLEFGGGLSIVTTKQLASLERIERKLNIPRKVEEIVLDEVGLKQGLQDGDILTLFPISPKFDNAVTLKGHVASPMRFAWRKGMRVTDLLSDNNALIPAAYWEAQNRGQKYARYANQEVNFDYATIQRLDPKTLTTRLFAFDLGKAIRGHVSANPSLEPGDIVTVYGWREDLPDTENAVTFTGEPLGGKKRFVWYPGMRITDVIPSTKWLVDYYDFWTNIKGEGKKFEVNWEYANIVRLDSKDLSKDTLPFNLGEAIKQIKSPHNLGLQPGDVVSIFTTEQIAQPVAKRKMYVQLHGEVVTPGSYQIQPGETLRQLVARVGGATPQAYLYAAEFYRESTRKNQQEKLDVVLDRMEKSMTLASGQAVQSALSSEDIAAQQAQQGFNRQVLARLRTVKATGRMVLEVPPDNNAVAMLPDIPLEDGDRLVIPAVPSNVNVVGEVRNENAFLFKPGKTLDDYLQQAGGPTRDGDEGALYVLKADGTVAASNGSWFGSWFRTSQIMPGDTIVVPILIERKSWTKDLKDWTQILYQFGMGVASLKVLTDL